MDPEYVLTMRVSKKTDVYAFGVVLLVVLSGRPAVDMRLEEDQQSLVWFAKKCMEEGRVDQIIDPYLKLEIQSSSLEEFIKIVEKCLLKQPKERPSMAQVVANLELAWENQQGAPTSMAQEMDGNWTAQFIDPMSDERYINSERDVFGDADILGEDPNFEKFRNGFDTHQRYEAEPYNPQDVVYQEEASKISQSPSFEQSIRIFSFSELKVATSNFRDDLKIGEGGDGIYYEGRLAGHIVSDSLVSVKRRTPQSFHSLKDSQDEMCMLRTLSHPNILNLIGYCDEKDEFLFVHKFMKNGSLDKHLLFSRNAGVQPLSWGLRLRICSDVARGLAFMHSLERPIIHRDIKLSKILLDETYNVKVSCPVFAWFSPMSMESTHVSTRVFGTYGYIDPEYMATGHLSLKSDVYSFGVILVEVLTGLRSIDPQRPREQHSLIDWTKASLSNKRKFRRIMDPCLDGKYSMGAALQAAQLALKCLASEQKMRPSMREVLQILEQIQSTNQIR
ncbi:hypothetical protein LIER_31474 [Lithospermum erythrorhizon]|uniref:Protein kinase domain-containing protein n=1 Tax=Lithospermum erythrorhizon TaxID=34254 RepID=A0AAV3RWE8_LITER